MKASFVVYDQSTFNEITALNSYTLWSIETVVYFAGQTLWFIMQVRHCGKLKRIFIVPVRHSGTLKRLFILPVRHCGTLKRLFCVHVRHIKTHFGTFQRYQDENSKLTSQQYRDWSDYTGIQQGLALYWWQILITFGSCMIRFKKRRVVQSSTYLFNKSIARKNKCARKNSY